MDGVRALLVDTCPTFQEDLGKVSESLQLRLVIEPDLLQAVELLKEGDFYLFFLHTPVPNLPVKDLKSFISQIKNEYLQLFFIAVTQECLLQQEKHRYREAGFSAYLSKPIEKSDLYFSTKEFLKFGKESSDTEK